MPVKEPSIRGKFDHRLRLASIENDPTKMHEAMVGDSLYTAYRLKPSDPRRDGAVEYARQKLSDAIIHFAKYSPWAPNYFRYQVLHDTLDTVMAHPDQPLEPQSRAHLLERAGSIGRQVLYAMNEVNKYDPIQPHGNARRTTSEIYRRLSGVKFELAVLALASWRSDIDEEDGRYGVLAVPHLDLFDGIDAFVRAPNAHGRHASYPIQATTAPENHPVRDGIPLVTPHNVFGEGTSLDATAVVRTVDYMASGGLVAASRYEEMEIGRAHV